MKLFPNAFHSWLSSVVSILRNFSEQTDLGMMWLGMDARDAHSLDVPGDKVRVCFRNNGDETLILCWVDSSGNPHHFYALQPHSGPDDDIVTEDDHVETTQTGHAFLILKASDVQEVQKSKSLEGTTLVGAYRPTTAIIPDNMKRLRKRLRTSTTGDCMHLVSIQKKIKNEVDCWSCCGKGTFFHMRHSQKEKDDKDGLLLLDKEGEPVELSWSLMVRLAHIDSKPIDSTCKRYVKLKMHEDMPVYAEENWHGGDEELEKIFRDDLHFALQCFPKEIRDRLAQGTAFWLNCSLKYGPAACPISGKGMCFHPESDWLVQNGCHKEKTHGIELYKASEYLRDRNHWGPGGVLIHELSHAYHCLCLPDGYDNQEILDCYQEAMDKGIYDSVAVHGTQGPKAKAYACTNAMEYFAELSTAFLGGTDDNIEFNKWFPFNRRQLREHDPRAFELLKKLWRVTM